MHAQRSIDLHGVVSRSDLLAAGLERGAIADRLKKGRLFPKYRGVYAVGRPDLTVWGERRAIVLACGNGATLSHRSAAGAWGLRPDGAALWDVTVPSARRTRAPVRIHRAALPAAERAELQGIPITGVARTLLDLSSVIEPHHLRRAIERAVALDLFHRPDVEAVLRAHPRRPGSPALRALLSDFAAHGETRTRSDLEALLLQICLDHGLPRPRINARDGGREIDATWPGSDLLVEVDSWAYHRSRRAFTADRAKDRAALRAGLA